MNDPSAEPSSHRRSLLEAAIQSLPVGVVVHDKQGRCVLANATARAYATDITLDPATLNVATAPGPAEILRIGDRDVEIHGGSLRTGGEAYRLTTIVDVTEQQAVQRCLVERAYLDVLTGLPNRALFEQSIADLIAAQEPGGRFALAFIDLDNFKNINDYYSHATGDILLTKVADRIRNQLGGTDMLARVGGDEFVLLLAPVQSCESAYAFVADLAGRLKQPFFIDGHEIFASASIGLSVYPDHGRSYDILRRQADSAMYRVKGGVKGEVIMFEASMAAAATARMAVEQRLRLAVRDRCFCCAYQPKVNLRTGEVTGVEILLRWRDEQGLIQAPGELVGLATELGLINDITLQVLAEAVRTVPDLDEAFGSEITLSLNVAAKQACDVAFMSTLCDGIAASGYAGRFILELTEEAFFTKGLFQREVLPRIRATGAKVSIDDFGVGYSSLAALAEITADELKIDRSFITDIHRRPRSQIVLRAIESLAQSLKMTVIAEGVETFEELAYLQAATQIHYAQGYYFARPMLIEQIIGAEGHRSNMRDPMQLCRATELRRHAVGRVA